jgi:dolichol-phosphate mannosyltransferase
VIPTLCEAQNISPLLDRVGRVLDLLPIDYEVLVVDDDSCDGTAEIVEAIGRRNPHVRLLVRRGQRGLSGAVFDGWEHTNAPIVGVMDADWQHPPELLAELVRAIRSGCDLAIASRYAWGGQMRGWDPIRRLFSCAAILATWPIQRNGIRARDPLSGFFLVRRDCLLGIPFQKSGFKLLLEILVRARISSMCELPFTFGRRFRGRSKANMKIALDYARLLSRLYRDKFGSRRVVSMDSAGPCGDPELL